MPLDDVPETSDAPVTNSDQHKGLDADALRAAIACVPDGQRRAIGMTRLQERTLQEAPAAGGMSVAARRAATHRGVPALRRMIKGAG